MTKDNPEYDDSENIDKSVFFPPIYRDELTSELNRLNSEYRRLYGQARKLQESADALFNNLLAHITEFRRLRIRVLMTKENKED